MSGLKVLLVEDDLVTQKMMGLLLERMGCQMDLAKNGQSALDHAADAEYDLILLDIGLPDIEGFEVSRRLRAMGVTSRIMAVTAHIDARYQDRCIDAGMDAFVNKPLTIGTLESVIAS